MIISLLSFDRSLVTERCCCWPLTGGAPPGPEEVGAEPHLGVAGEPSDRLLHFPFCKSGAVTTLHIS